jgi:hypothetical protein
VFDTIKPNSPLSQCADDERLYRLGARAYVECNFTQIFNFISNITHVELTENMQSIITELEEAAPQVYSAGIDF